MIDIGVLSSGYSTEVGAINNRGEMVGRAGNDAFYWTLLNGIVLLPTLPGGSIVARDINDDGKIVGILFSSSGNSGVYWDNGSVYNLTDLVEDSNWTITSAVAINGSGQIAAVGTHPSFGSNQQALLLTPRAVTDPATPVPEPSAAAFILLGAIISAGVGSFRPRR